MQDIAREHMSIMLLLWLLLQSSTDCVPILLYVNGILSRMVNCPEGPTGV